ncbi:hypothetical protein RUND412_000899 [Rhizina undulata]
MAAIAFQQSQNPPASNTPSFFNSAFSEMNVFEQCFNAATQDPKPELFESASAFSPDLSHHLLPTPPAHFPRFGVSNAFSPFLQESPTTPPYIDYNDQNNPFMTAQDFQPLPAGMWPGTQSPGCSAHDPSFSPHNVGYSIGPFISTPPNKFDSDIRPQSPLDHLVGCNTETRSVHGQITPPEDMLSAQYLPADEFDMFGNHDQREFGEPSEPSEQSNSPRKRQGSTQSGMAERYGVRKSKKQARSATNIENIQESKRKKFLERNRVAASKCRQKKKMWMQDLEENARSRQQESKYLHGQVSELRDELLKLKTELLSHDGCDCEPIKRYLITQASIVADGASGCLEKLRHPSTMPSRQLSTAHSRQPSTAPTESSSISFDDIDGSDNSEEFMDSRTMSMSVFESMQCTPQMPHGHQFSPI